jgi:hypothetical protein
MKESQSLTVLDKMTDTKGQPLKPVADLCGRLWYAHEVIRDASGTVTHLGGQSIAEMSFFELFPDLKDELQSLTLGGKPVYGEDGFPIRYDE